MTTDTGAIEDAGLRLFGKVSASPAAKKGTPGRSILLKERESVRYCLKNL